MAFVYDFEKIKELRTAKNLTQKQCADRADVAYQQWQRWENNESVPSAVALGDIAIALEISPNELYRIVE